MARIVFSSAKLELANPQTNDKGYSTVVRSAGRKFRAILTSAEKFVKQEFYNASDKDVFRSRATSGYVKRTGETIKGVQKDFKLIDFGKNLQLVGNVFYEGNNPSPLADKSKTIKARKAKFMSIPMERAVGGKDVGWSASKIKSIRSLPSFKSPEGRKKIFRRRIRGGKGWEIFVFNGGGSSAKTKYREILESGGRTAVLKYRAFILKKLIRKPARHKKPLQKLEKFSKKLFDPMMKELSQAVLLSKANEALKRISLIKVGR
jgi:hypothetical protein